MSPATRAIRLLILTLLTLALCVVIPGHAWLEHGHSDHNAALAASIVVTDADHDSPCDGSHHKHPGHHTDHCQICLLAAGLTLTVVQVDLAPPTLLELAVSQVPLTPVVAPCVRLSQSRAPPACV